jgi:hypothetical protein
MGSAKIRKKKPTAEGPISANKILSLKVKQIKTKKSKLNGLRTPRLSSLKWILRSLIHGCIHRVSELGMSHSENNP